MRISTFDTTLRDGTQGEAVSFSVDDKMLVAKKLDDLGIDYIEGGWPGSNPRDREFFAKAKSELKLKHAKLTAFGATRFAKNPVHEDRNVRELLEAETPVIAVFGKSWDLHVHRALGISEAENLTLISETVKYLKDHGREVVYDAEHFFDGYLNNKDFALRTLDAACKAGADILCLCDTNGGTPTSKLAAAVADVRARFGAPVGIHVHNDCDIAVANTLAAVENGAVHVQGCMNGYGERCGNANLASVIANLELKAGHETIGRERLELLTSTVRYIAELANLPVPRGAAFVGQSAFAHKGGVHVSAILKDSATYEHIRPELVGNHQRVLVSDLSGRSNINYKLERYDPAGQLDDASRRKLLERIKDAEFAGYDLEAADGNFELFVLEALRPGRTFFDVLGYEVVIRAGGNTPATHTATVRVNARDGEHSATVSGNGPVNALDLCLRKCISALYPEIGGVRLTDYKVRVLDSGKGTAAKVRVLVEWSDGDRQWSTVGVSEDVIEASWDALVSALRLELLRIAPAAPAIA